MANIDLTGVNALVFDVYASRTGSNLKFGLVNYGGLKTPFRPSDIPTGLQGYWKFNNNANDSSANGYNLTAVNSPTYTDDTYWKDGEKSVTYGGGSYHKIENASCPNLNLDGAEQSITVHAIVQLSATAENSIVNKYSSGDSKGFILGTSDATTVEFSVGNGTFTQVNGGYLLVGKKHFVTGVLDATLNKVMIYVDGNLISSADHTAGIGGNTNEFRTGVNYAGNDPYDGNIKDVAVWNVALTPLQVKSLALGIDLSKYAYRPNNVSTQPTHWWPLNEVSGNRYVYSPTTDRNQGHNGGTGYSSGGEYEGGGGGGAGAVGGPAVGSGGGAGGAGRLSAITGTTLAGGGGGGGVSGGGAGSNGGGNGGNNSSGTNATANTGSGGGGADTNSSIQRDGGNGGSGLVVVRYPLAAGTGTGGTITTDAIYRIHTFNSSDTFVPPSATTVDYLVIGGGGGGGGGAAGDASMGGGGAGGFIEKIGVSISTGSYSVVVGDGGAGGIALPADLNNGDTGEISSFNGTVALGGGSSKGTGNIYGDSGNGASGGGGAWFCVGGIGNVTDTELFLTDNNTVLSSGGYVEGVGADFEKDNSEYFSVADSADWDVGTGDYSIRLRAKWESVASAGLFDRAGDLSFRYGADGKIKVEQETTETATYAWVPVAGVFYDLVARRVSGVCEIFIDGIEVSSVAGTQDIQGTNGITIGKELSNYFDGVIEDVAFWKGYALTDAEIKSLACALPIQRQGIVSYWKLNEQSGSRVDSLGTNTLTDNDTVLYGTGKVDNAADFDKTGNTEFLSVANNDSIDLTSDLTILLWSKLETLNSQSWMFDKDMFGTGYGLGVFGGSSDTPAFYIANDAIASSVTVAAAAWHHYVGVYDGSSKSILLDGVVVGTEAFTTNPSDTTSGLAIGRGITGGYTTDGLIDESILSKRYFRPEEIKAVYLKGLNGKEATSSEMAFTIETTPNITSSNSWQSVTWDLSGVSDYNKNNIDKFIITVMNADTENTFYVDNFGTAIVPVGWTHKIYGINNASISKIISASKTNISKVSSV